MSTRRLRLSNGLRCHLHHQPDAHDAAALMRVQAGSLDEPNSKAGLAHLLEHVLFCGSARFNDTERLMPWIQQQSGEVNATTQLNHSAYFFQLPAAALPGGVQRLCDMVAAPLLTRTSIEHEITVIDAEYHLLQNHVETLSQAALLDGLRGRFQRFRIGNRASFGDSISELQSALRVYHRRFYCADTSTLWLQGPQSLDELEKIASQFGGQLSPGGESTSVSLAGLPTGQKLQLAGNEHFWLTLCIDCKTRSFSDNITLIRTFWLDSAPGGLLAQLRQEGLCDALQVKWLWQDGAQGLLALRFSAERLTPQMAQLIEKRFWQHLGALQTTRQHQRRHYWQLAEEDFASLTPLAQLHARALHLFAPVSSVPPEFNTFLSTISYKRATRLLTQEQLNDARHIRTQGFVLAMVPWSVSPLLPTERVHYRFYPITQPVELPTLPSIAQKLPLITPRQQRETLILRPAFYHPLGDEAAMARQHELRPVLAELRHFGGFGCWQPKQGVWQLTLNLPPYEPQALQSVCQVIKALNLPLKTRPVAAHSIVIRQLMAALPCHLIAPEPKGAWMAAWCGQQHQWHRPVAHLLSHLNHKLATFTPSPVLQSGIALVRCNSGEQALLLFMPLPHPDDFRLAALRALALMLGPNFFQRLRVEQKLGYVASACYQRVADVDGLLLALQSPDVAWHTLLSHCEHFMREMMTEILLVTPEMLGAWQNVLLGQCEAQNNEEAALQALRERHGLADLKRHAVESLTLYQLHQLHGQLLQERHRWRIVIATETG